MQKTFTAFLFLLPGFIFAQSIQDQKVTIKYTQLPSININDGSGQYSVAIETPYLQRNQDSLNNYELAKSAYMKEVEAALENWRLQSSGGDRNYWAQMANYETQVNNGVQGLTMPQPSGAAPFVFNKPYPRKPFLLKEINASSVIAGVNIEGLKQNNDAPVKITLIWNGFEKGQIRENKSGTGPTTKYKFDIQYRHRINVKIEVPGKGIVLNEMISGTDGYSQTTTGEFKTKADFRLWWIDNENSFWEQRQQEIVMQHMNAVNSYLNDKVGYPKRSRTIEVFTMKSKDYDYGDYLKAFTAAQDGYLKVEYKDKAAESKQKLQEAITIWETALKESDINNRKARIDAHVTAATYINVANAYCWMGDYVNCELNCNKALGVDIGKYNRDARPLIEFARYMKQRAEANQK